MDTKMCKNMREQKIFKSIPTVFMSANFAK